MPDMPDEATIARYQKVARDMQKPVDKPHSCSYSTSHAIGGSAECRIFLCRECGEEWEKDVS